MRRTAGDHGILLGVLLTLSGWAVGGRAEDVPVFTDLNAEAQASREQLARELLPRLKGTKPEALNAAYRLARLGRASVPPLVEFLQNQTAAQPRYYAAFALSKITGKDAALALVPFLLDDQTPRDLRLLAIEAMGGEGLEAAVPKLKQLVATSVDAEIRMKALQSLSVIPTSWSGCEELFVKGLTDSDQDVQGRCIQLCLQAASLKVIYGSAEPVLMELAEKGSPVVRCRALAALARMRSQLTVSLIIRMLADAETPAPVVKTALESLRALTEIHLKDATAAQTWWRKYGETRYAHASPLRSSLPNLNDPGRVVHIGEDGRPVRPAPPVPPAAGAPNGGAPAPLRSDEDPRPAAPVSLVDRPATPSGSSRPALPDGAVTRPAAAASSSPPTAPRRTLEDDPATRPFGGVPMN